MTRTSIRVSLISEQMLTRVWRDALSLNVCRRFESSKARHVCKQQASDTRHRVLNCTAVDSQNLAHIYLQLASNISTSGHHSEIVCCNNTQIHSSSLNLPSLFSSIHSPVVRTFLSCYVSDIDGHIPRSRFPSVFHPSCPSTIFVYLLKWLVVGLTSRMSDFDSRTISMSGIL